MSKITVITPTVGRKELNQAMESVQNQTVKEDIFHLIVGDGPDVFSKLFQGNLNLSIPYSDDFGVQFTFAPINTGANGFYGHRIYAAYPHLVDSEFILFLDEDNWWEPNHVETLVNLVETENLEFAYSLRNVYIENTFHAEDKCESIGKWPIYGLQGIHSDYLVDTSAYCFRRSWLIKHCQNWHAGWGADRRFYSNVREKSNHNTSGLHTLNYRLPDMDKAYGGDLRFFERGNEYVKKLYGGYPWKN